MATMFQLESVSLPKLFILLSFIGAGITLFAVVVRLLEVETENTAASRKLPWVARPPGPFWKTKVGFKFMKSYRKYLQEAYDTVSLTDLHSTMGPSC